MPKKSYKHFNYLEIIYIDGSFEIVRDESSVIWSRYRALLENFSIKTFVGVLSVSVLDNAKRKIVSLNFDCYGKTKNFSNSVYRRYSKSF